MSKHVAIVQSSYIPWKGYFDLINSVDEFILYDDMQYTRRDWRNRNIIKSINGPLWLTVPVNVKGKYTQQINETTISEPGWGQKHWLTFVHNYSKAAYFKKYRPIFENLYLSCEAEKFLSQINFKFIQQICDLLGIKTNLSWSTDYRGQGTKTERLVSLCKSASATHYLSGPSAQNYIEPKLFEDENIHLSYIDYSNYPIYAQLFGEFDHHVSILDLLFNMGEEAINYMKSFKK